MNKDLTSTFELLDPSISIAKIIDDFRDRDWENSLDAALTKNHSRKLSLIERVAASILRKNLQHSIYLTRNDEGDTFVEMFTSDHEGHIFCSRFFDDGETHWIIFSESIFLCERKDYPNG